MNKKFNLGNLIDALEKVPRLSTVDEKKEKFIVFDFGSAIPTVLDSWRGDYSHLSVGYTLTGHDGSEQNNEYAYYSTFLNHLKAAIGETFTGWKGGEYKMSRDSELWVANPGNSGNTGICGIKDEGYFIILHTAYFDYY